MSDIEVKTVAAPIEGVKEIENPTPKEEVKPIVDESAKRFAQMARREKILLQRDREIKQREEAIRTREEAIKAPPQVDWKAELQKNPLKVLEEAGLPYDALVQRLLNENPMDHNMSKLASEIQALRDEQKTVKQQLEDQQNNSYKQAVNQVKVEVKRTLAERPDDFEVLSSHGEEATDAVVQLIQKTFETEGYVMDVDTAAQEVEDYLLDRVLGLAKLKKVQAKLTPTQEAAQAELPVPKNATTQVIPREQPKTLTHTMNGVAGPLTDRQRRERAILAFQGKLT